MRVLENENTELKITDKQAMLLSVLAYVDIHNIFNNYEYVTGHSLEEIYFCALDFESRGGKFLPNGGFTHEEIMEKLKEIYKDEFLKKLVIAEYLNDNKKVYNDNDFTGFVGLALNDSNGGTYILSRGSEGTYQQEAEGAPSVFLSKDWLDNFEYVSKDSGKIPEQFTVMLDFVKRNKSLNHKPTFVFGHSKGAANSMYAAAALENVTGKVFDGPGISQILSEEQRMRLKDSGLKNYVADGDIVGALLKHEEEIIYVKTSQYYPDGAIKYVFVKNDGNEEIWKELTLDKNKRKDIFNFHYLQSLYFDKDGSVVPIGQGKWSKFASVISNEAYDSKIDLEGLIISFFECSSSDDKFAGMDLNKFLSKNFDFKLRNVILGVFNVLKQYN